MSIENRIIWINSEIQRNQQYHNHKESMAWLATALYVSGAFALSSQHSELVDACQKALALITAVAITGLAFWFVCWQFNNRKIAAERIKKLIETAEQYMKNVGEEDDKLAWYFGEVKEYRIDPEKTQVISLIAMGIAFAVFIISVFR